MASERSNQFYFIVFVYCIITLTLSSDISKDHPKPRSVFPLDYVKFTCRKARDIVRAEEPRNDICTWAIFKNSTEPETNVTRECVKIIRNETITKGNFDFFEGYVQVPEEVQAIGCIESDGQVYEPTKLSVQKVKLANPTFRHEGETPTIILQRFSDDYGARYGAHDVTNQEIFIDGTEVESMKLLCVHDTKLEWVKITNQKERIWKDLQERDKRWLLSKSSKLEKGWKVYLNFLLEAEKGKMSVLNVSRSDLESNATQLIYTLPLTIRSVTNKTTRTYECRSLKTQNSSKVSINVQNPKALASDEIEMIQHIVGILDSLAQGKGKGNEPWYSLASLLSIILIIFMYYCRLKLVQQTCNPQPPQQSPSKPEETEMRARLQSPAQNQSDSEQQQEQDQENQQVTLRQQV